MLPLLCALLTLSTLTTLASTAVLLRAARRWRSAAVFWRQECLSRPSRRPLRRYSPYAHQEPCALARLTEEDA